MAFITFYLHVRVLELEQQNQDLHIQSMFPSFYSVRLVSLGYDRLVADLYWLAFVNYIGDSRNRSVDKYKLADKYLDIVTGLDPKFVQPFWYCAFTVGADQKRPYRASELLHRGITANPDNWYLKYIAGINAFLFAHDEVSAAQWYAQASLLPGAPSWLSRQSKILAAHIPSKLKQIDVWTSIFETEPSHMVRLHAKAELILLWSEIYASSPPGEIREKARRALSSLDQQI